MNRDYRRGLNRIYLVLTGAWILFCLVWSPYSMQAHLRNLSMNGDGVVFQSCREDANQLPAWQKDQWTDKCWKQYEASLAKDDQIPHFSYGGAFGWALAAAVLVPVLLYGLLYGAFLLIRWIVSGFAKVTK